MKALLLLGVLISVSASAKGMMLVRNSDRGVQDCKEFLEDELNAKGKLTVKDARENTGAHFFNGNELVGWMYPTEDNPDMCDCEVAQ